MSEPHAGKQVTLLARLLRRSGVELRIKGELCDEYQALQIPHESFPGHLDLSFTVANIDEDGDSPWGFLRHAPTLKDWWDYDSEPSELNQLTSQATIDEVAGAVLRHLETHPVVRISASIVHTEDMRRFKAPKDHADCVASLTDFLRGNQLPYIIAEDQSEEFFDAIRCPHGTWIYFVAKPEDAGNR